MYIGKLIKVTSDGEMHVRCVETGQDYMLTNPLSSLDGDLDECVEGALLHNVRQRYGRGQMQTAIGSEILISMNDTEHNYGS